MADQARAARAQELRQVQYRPMTKERLEGILEHNAWGYTDTHSTFDLAYEVLACWAELGETKAEEDY